LEKCFEKLEKEKEKEIISYSVSGPAAEHFFLAQSKLIKRRISVLTLI
jgi:hypothetical protein